VVEPEDEGDRDDFPREWDGTMQKCSPPPKPNDEMEHVRRQGLLNRAAEAIHLARYDDLEGLAIDSEMRRAICEATDAWRKLVDADAAIAAEAAERAEKAAENAIVASPAAEPAEQPADVIEPDCDGELVWCSSES
jgi:hypothetical protein